MEDLRQLFNNAIELPDIPLPKTQLLPSVKHTRPTAQDYDLSETGFKNSNTLSIDIRSDSTAIKLSVSQGSEVNPIEVDKYLYNIYTPDLAESRDIVINYSIEEREEVIRLAKIKLAKAEDLRIIEANKYLDKISGLPIVDKLSNIVDLDPIALQFKK